MKALIAILLFSILTATSSWGICSVSSSGFSFVVDPAQPLTDTIGSVTVICNTTTNYTLTLSTGSSSVYQSRTLHRVNNGAALPYNLYPSPGAVGVLGDGTSGTNIITGTATANVPATHTLYGRISGAQNASVGAYSDNVVATLTYQ